MGPAQITPAETTMNTNSVPMFDSSAKMSMPQNPVIDLAGGARR